MTSGILVQEINSKQLNFLGYSIIQQYLSVRSFRTKKNVSFSQEASKYHKETPQYLRKTFKSLPENFVKFCKGALSLPL